MNVKKVASTLVVVVAVVTFYMCFGCPIRYLTGVCCAGCGMSRAAVSLLKLDFASAFYFNPLVFTMPFFGILMIVFRKNRRRLQVTVGVLCVALLVVYLYRMITASAPDVVYFAPEQGMIYKFVRSVIYG